MASPKFGVKLILLTLTLLTLCKAKHAQEDLCQKKKKCAASTSFLSPHLTVQLGEVKEKREKQTKKQKKNDAALHPPPRTSPPPTLIHLT